MAGLVVGDGFLEPPNEQPVARRDPSHLPQSVTRALAATLVAFAVAVLAGWAFGVDLLRRPNADQVQVNPTTGMLFALAGVSLWLLLREDVSRRRRTAGRVCAALVALHPTRGDRATNPARRGQYGLPRGLHPLPLLRRLRSSRQARSVHTREHAIFDRDTATHARRDAVPPDGLAQGRIVLHRVRRAQRLPHPCL